MHRRTVGLIIANEASPQQAAGYQTEGHCWGDTTVSPPSSLCKVTSEQAPRNLLIKIIKYFIL